MATSESAPLVQVLLSTYNGELFIGELMESLLAQDYPNLQILVRDDGSSDGTLALLAKFLQGGQVRVIRGQNVGVVRSFFELLAQAETDADYVAFCDQDDVWLSEKVGRAVEMLREKVPDHVPGLYMGRYTVVDEKLNVLRQSYIPRYEPSFPNALVQNIAPGCTMVLNRAAVSVLVGRLPGEAVQVHDWWVYLAIAGLGRVVYDPESFMLYRLHGANTIGAEKGFLDKWAGRVKRFIGNGGLHVITRQAVELQRIYGAALPPERASILTAFLTERGTLLDRLAYVFRTPVHRQSAMDDIILKTLLLCNQV